MAFVPKGRQVLGFLHYLPKPPGWALPSLGADETLSNCEIHDLLKGTFVRGYRPAEAGGGFDERAQQYLYNSYGLKKSEGLWLGDHWARTDF